MTPSTWCGIKKGRWIEATKAEYDRAPEERRKILYSKPPLLNLTGEQLYNLVAKGWRVPWIWEELPEMSQEAWNKAAADLVWGPDTIAHKLAFEIERDKRMFEEAMKPVKGK